MLARAGFPGIGVGRPNSRAPAFPAQLFYGGESGAWYDPSDLSTVFQERTGASATTSATVGDPVGTRLDKSGNGAHQTAPSDAARPTLQDSPIDHLDHDEVDDQLEATLPALTGDYFLALPQGLVHARISVGAGTWAHPIDARFMPDGGRDAGLLVRDGTLSADEIAAVEDYYQGKGSSGKFAGVTSMRDGFRGRTDLTEIFAGDWNTASVTNFGNFVRGCSSLTSLDVSGWDTSSVTNFGAFAQDCSSLTSLDVSAWDTSSVTNFGAFARDCSSLTSLDVSAWDTSSVTNFGNFVRDCSSLTSLDVSAWDTSSVTDFQFFAFGCSSLTSLDVSAWDTSSVTTFLRFAQGCSSLTTINCGTAFDNTPATNFADAFTNTNLDQAAIDEILVSIEKANTSNGTFDQSGGNAPSATGEAAIDALRARGWTVTVTGGY